MYKLLLVTDREEVVNTFNRVENLSDLMIAPITIINDIEEAIEYLERHAVDGVGYSFRYNDPSRLHNYLTELRPSLPIFQTHHHDETLQDELLRVRRFLDRIRADDRDEDYDEVQVIEYLRDELMQQLLSREIASPMELKSRLKLVRGQDLSLDKPAFLVDFDMPQGDLYLGDRWHYGRERLESALRSNFFGRFHDGIYYGLAMLSPRHIRLIACQSKTAPPEDTDVTAQRVQNYVHEKLAQIKTYLDLNLEIEQFTILGCVNDIADNPHTESIDIGV
ncbi:MAG: hypothetical protein GX858_00575 [Clostridiales bacterium]|nr:hypothetical protein [Clostridiales bacterium]